MANAQVDTTAADDWWKTMRELLDALLAVPQKTRAEHPPFPRHPGVYLLSDATGFRYVGQTRNIRERVAQHSRPSGSHNNATLAFLLAARRARDAGIPLSGTRSEIEKDAAFSGLFLVAKREVADWTVQFVEINDANCRTLFEVYVHLSLDTDLNTFETH